MDIFNENNNVILSNLNKDELYNILNNINGYKLKLRDNLLISDDITFSPEIEFICRSFDRAKRIFYNKVDDNWLVKKEPCIGGGFEIVPNSFLKNNINDYNSIKKILNIIKKDPISYIDYRCGLHINIGTQIFDDEDHIKRFMLLWLAYEEVIFRFCYGEYLNPRHGIPLIALPIRNSNNYSYDEIYNLLRFTKTKAFNLVKASSYYYKYDNVVEFRCPNGTYNPSVLQNDLNLFVHMIDYSKDKIDVLETIDIINRKKDVLLPNYNKIYLNEALEFSDKIFDNILDKSYFLKQYLKNNKEIKYDKDLDKMIKCKRF